MATTTNFGWETPDDTDLVKDGALAMRTLGNAIDASLVDLKGGTTGQVLSKTSNTDMDFTWVTSDDANAIQNAIVDAKGDLISASAADTPARLAVGNNGETLVADSSATTGLRWQGNFAAGKNAIINGDMRIWQRGTSFTPASNVNQFTADRFGASWNGTGTSTFSQQSFTAGAAPAAPYESPFFLRLGLSSGATYVQANQKIEDVRTMSGNTVTLSFWAKASSSGFTNRPIVRQNFGSGGSGNVDVSLADTTLTTSWTRYTYTFSLASVSGKTIGTNSCVEVFFINYQTGTIASQSIDIWGVQLEIGNTATAFQTATGTLAGELAACQRYYYRTVADNAYTQFGNGSAKSTTQAQIMIPFPVTMRVAPTALTYGNLVLFDGTTIINAGTVTLNYNGRNVGAVDCTTTGMTDKRAYFMLSDNTTAGFIAFSAEL